MPVATTDPTPGITTVPLKILGVSPVIVAVPTLGVMTVLCTTTLGAEPMSNASPAGVIILPLTTSGF